MRLYGLLFASMRPALLLLVIVFAPFLQQRSAEREDSDVKVLRFTWARERQNNLIRGAQNPGGPIVTPSANNQDLTSRRAEMHNGERKAKISAERSGETYHLRLEVQNGGPNAVKSFVWEFRPTAGPDDYEPKQYLCALRLKPKEKKILDLWTPFAPSKVINASARADALKDGEVVVNKIEYVDGSVWKKRGWTIELPPDSTQSLSNGGCSVF